MGKYDDIIDLPHHVSATRPRMSMQERAAQFSPFAALLPQTGKMGGSQPSLTSYPGPSENKK